MTTGWLAWLAATAMIGVSAFHLSRLARPRGAARDVGIGDEITHLAMSSVMAVMFLDRGPLSGGRPLAALFGATLAWFVWRAVHGYVMDGAGAVGRPARQAVGCAAMVWMLVAWSQARSGGMAMASTITSSTTTLSAVVTSPVVTTALIVATLGVASATLIRPRSVGFPAAPPLVAGCQVAMNAAMVYMLVAM